MCCNNILKRVLIIIGVVCALCAGNATAQTDSAVLSSAVKYGRLITKWFLPKNTTIATGNAYYVACSFYGILLFGQSINDTSYRDTTSVRYKKLGTNPGTINNMVDYNVHGILPFELYRETKYAPFLGYGKRLADDEFATAHLRTDTLTTYSRFWVDDMYMIASLQVNAYRNYVDSIRYLNNATRTLVRYIDSIQQPGGLFYHAPCMGAHYYWGRGNGWAASAMTEALLAMPLTHPARAHIMTAYLRQMSALIKYQDQVGLWHQLVTDTTTYKETSCTGMFVYALATGVKQGWLVGDTFKLAAKRGWMALAPCLDTINGLRYVCTGFGATSDSLAYRTHAQATGDAHGTAGYIWAATAMVRMLTPSTHTIDSKIPQRTLVQKNSRTDNRIFDLSGRYAGQASANGIDNAQNRASMSHGCFISNGKKVLKLEK